MPRDTAQPSPAASAAAGKDGSIRPARTAQDVQDALRRLREPKMAEAITAAMKDPRGVVFLWGESGLAILTILENAYDGRFAFISWLQNDREYEAVDVSPTIERWADYYGCQRIAAAVERGSPDAWKRLTGYEPWKLVISKSL